ncbi:hypothetical protein [Sphingomonas sp.]|uniref:hypothetical protein n=1 Tax=Sphingomonas sp. TaxID=28214 RepID=UPI001B14B1BE|nr:hypothetical protein [Sphingomonas sp.]MBO9711901.1 hypothetical protein [Sphingomonas sp.]
MRLLGFLAPRARSGAVVLLPDRMIVSSHDDVRRGPSIERRAWRIEDPGDPIAIGAALHRALSESRNGVRLSEDERRHPTRFPTLAISGLRSFRAFMAAAQTVSVYQRGQRITLTPTDNQGARGFAHLPDQARELRAPGDAELGAAVLAAFADCT